MLKLRHDLAKSPLTAAEIDRMRRFGEVRHYSDRDFLFEAGKPSPGLFVVLSGHVSLTQRDGLGRIAPIDDRGVGEFLGETAQLSDRMALVDGQAEGDVETLLIKSERLRALIVAEADLGERIMRALILRRVGLLHGGTGGPALIGSAVSTDMLRLQSFLARNGCPYHVLDPTSDDATDLVLRHSSSLQDLPLVIVPDGTILKNPSRSELARAMGMFSPNATKKIYDVAIVGSGPAGLSTAVYAASEGLSVAVCDARAFGGQAGASARIENCFGFPTGISGQALTARAFNQALKFGAEMMIPVTAKRLDCSRTDGMFGLEIEGGAMLKARSIVIASGARYRRPNIARLSDFEGHGVWYWASPIEGSLCKGQNIIIFGGGNSAGQAAVFLANHAAQVQMVVRGQGLASSMSRYLIDRVETASNIQISFNTEIVAFDGEQNVSRVTMRNRSTGQTEIAAVSNVFLFVGADPATDWLSDCGVMRDKAGFVITGVPFRGEAVRPLETSVRGVFAAGDVRAGSVKRVGGAIGEGANVAAALHAFLSEMTVI